MKVLVIEDDEGCRKGIVSFLRKMGYTVLECSNGQAGLNILDQVSDVDLVFSDLQMPVLSGFAVVERIKASAKWSKIIVILCSADTSENLQHEAIRLGAYSFLHKPIDILELMTTLKTIKV